MEENVVLVGMAAVPAIAGILQAVKRFIPENLVGLAAMAMGATWNVSLTIGTDEFDRTAVFMGIIIGLAASGFYSTSRAAVEEASTRLKR